MSKHSLSQHVWWTLTHQKMTNCSVTAPVANNHNIRATCHFIGMAFLMIVLFFEINVDSFSQRKTKVSLDMLKLFSQPCVVNYD